MRDESSRSSRALLRRNRRRVVGFLVIVVSASLVAWGIAALTSREGTISPNSAAGAGGAKPASLLLFGVSADPSFVAVVGTGGSLPPAAAVVPPSTLATMPVEGSGTIAEAMRVSPERGRVATANMLGAWITHYAVLDLKGLSTLIDRRGGLIVDLPPGVTISGQAFSQGPAKLTGDQVVGYLTTATGNERTLRWQDVVGPLLSGPLQLDSHQAQMDDQGAVQAALALAARGTSATQIPTVPSQAGLLQPDAAALRRLLVTTFGLPDRVPVKVIVLNGTPHTRTAELIAGDLVPAGYRIAAFGDARGTHHKSTLIVTSVSDAVPQANRIQKVLRVGRVFLGGEASGIADITIIVGKDYLRA